MNGRETMTTAAGCPAQPRQVSEQWLRVLDLGVKQPAREEEPLALRLCAGLVWSFS
jgi:hypothetical protein